MAKTTEKGTEDGEAKITKANSNIAEIIKDVTGLLNVRGENVIIGKNLKADPSERDIIRAHLKTTDPEGDLSGKFLKDRYIFFVKAPFFTWSKEIKPCREREMKKRELTIGPVIR